MRGLAVTKRTSSSMTSSIETQENDTEVRKKNTSIYAYVCDQNRNQPIIIMSTRRLVTVVGATGAQGGAVVRSLLETGKYQVMPSFRTKTTELCY